MSCKKNGTFADYFLSLEENLHPIPAEMDLELGFLGEPLACVIVFHLQLGVSLETPWQLWAWDSLDN